MTVICSMARHRTPRLDRRTVPVVPRSRGPVDVLVAVDRRADLALHEQLERTLRDAIRAGRLHAGAELPSSRGLAGELGVSRGVVTTAHDQLAAGGYPQTRQGAPPRVAPPVRAPPPPPPPPAPLPPV